MNIKPRVKHPEEAEAELKNLIFQLMMSAEKHNFKF